MNDVYTQMVTSIIKHQEAIIGPVAVEQAQKIAHLTIDWKKQDIRIDGDPVLVIDALVESYSQLFGLISIEVSKEAAASYLRQLHPRRLPHSLA